MQLTTTIYGKVLYRPASIDVTKRRAFRRKEPGDSGNFYGCYRDKFSGQQRCRRADSTMSESEPNNTGGQSTAQYSTECRKCDRVIHASVPVDAVVHNVEGVRVRCAGCKATNFIQREDSGNE